jgi:hypothetical protein
VDILKVTEEKRAGPRSVSVSKHVDTKLFFFVIQRPLFANLYFHGPYAAFRSIPPEVSKLTKLEHLTMKRNHVDRISDQMRNMASLRTLNLRYNNLTHTSIPPEIFENEELTTLGMYCAVGGPRITI